MRFIDRFTRDEVSAKVWWPVALVCLIALILTIPGANRAAEQTRDAAAARAAAASAATIQPLTTIGAPAATLTIATQQLVASDPSLTAVRIWDAQHRLVVSSDRGDQLESEAALNDADLDAAVAGGSVWVVTDRLPTGDAGPPTYYAYTAVDGAAGTMITQFETADATLLAGVHDAWTGYRIVLGVALVLLLALALLSMREPVAPIGAHVPFYPESVPGYLRLIDVDRSVALEQAGDRAKERVVGLQQKLDESERLRLKAEGQLQQALASLSGSGRGMPSPKPIETTPSPSAPAASTAQPSPRLHTPPTPAAATAAVAAAEAAKAKKEPKEKPGRHAAKPAAAKRTPAPKVEPAPAPPPMPVAEPAPEPITVATDDLSVTATSKPAEEPSTWPEVVVLPDPEPARSGTAARRGTGNAADIEHADVLEVLNRLVPDTPLPDAADDPSEMRAKLARTAALKKPGSRERQEEREGP